MSTSLDHYHKRRQESFIFLGGKCAKCGCIPTIFEFDHIDPTTKEFTLGKKWSVDEETYYNELKKCQILCKECHNRKTAEEKGYQYVKGQNKHGTISTYRYCKCLLCKEAKRQSNQKYKDKWNKQKREKRRLEKEKKALDINKNHIQSKADKL
jgi:hypothetical protein